MKKEEPIRILWHPRRLCAYITFCSVLEFLLILLIMIALSKITRPDVWWWCIEAGMFYFFVPLTCVYLFIWLRSKDQISYLYLEQKIIIKGKKKFHYIDYDTSQTTWFQKKFGLITIKFIGENERVVLKDVSKELLEYVKKEKGK